MLSICQWMIVLIHRPYAFFFSSYFLILIDLCRCMLATVGPTFRTASFKFSFVGEEHMAVDSTVLLLCFAQSNGNKLPVLFINPLERFFAFNSFQSEESKYGKTRLINFRQSGLPIGRLLLSQNISPCRLKCSEESAVNWSLVARDGKYLVVNI